MIDIALTFATSLLLGMRHATDPDHVVAVTTIVSRERSARTACGIGVMWGLGHTVTILLVGGAIVLLRLAFPPRLGLALELAVACMLVVLGALNLLDVRARSRTWTNVRPLVVGVVHGLAGSAAATLLVLPLVPDPRWALLYLVVFGAGTVVGMAAVTLAMAAPTALVAARAASRVAGMHRALRLMSGVASLAFGAYLFHRIGIVDGLFAATPRWTPQ
jgi:High-affinity nickel-transport protein